MDIIKEIADKYNVDISENSIQELTSILKKNECQKDEIILKEGTISRYLYLVEKKIIRQFYYKNGRDITEHFSHEGCIATCLESLFLREPTKLIVEAIEPSVIYLLDYEKWGTLVTTQPPNIY